MEDMLYSLNHQRAKTFLDQCSKTINNSQLQSGSLGLPDRMPYLILLVQAICRPVAATRLYLDQRVQVTILDQLRWSII